MPKWAGSTMRQAGIRVKAGLEMEVLTSEGWAVLIIVQYRFWIGNSPRRIEWWREEARRLLLLLILHQLRQLYLFSKARAAEVWDGILLFVDVPQPFDLALLAVLIHILERKPWVMIVVICHFVVLLSVIFWLSKFCACFDVVMLLLWASVMPMILCAFMLISVESLYFGVAERDNIRWRFSFHVETVSKMAASWASLFGSHLHIFHLYFVSDIAAAIASLICVLSPIVAHFLLFEIWKLLF